MICEKLLVDLLFSRWENHKIVIQFQIHGCFAKCNENRMTSENEGVTYPTIASTHKIVQNTGRFPNWSLSTWRLILLSMDFRLQKVSDLNNAFMIESEHIVNWREKYLINMDQHRFDGRPIHCK